MPDLERVAHDFAERFIDTSDCEQSTLSLAQSIAAKGTLVIVCVSIPHFIVRWYEDLFVTLGYKSIPIVLIGVPPLNTNDQKPSFARPEMMLAHTIPSLTIIAPATHREVGTLLTQACKLRRPVYIHFERDRETGIAVSKLLPTLFEPIEYSHGTQVICIGIGSALDKAHQAKLLLESYGYSSSLVSLHTIKPLNSTFLHRIMHSYSAIFTFEDHDSTLCLGHLIGAFIAENRRRTILFKAFCPGIEPSTPQRSTSAHHKTFDMRSAGLEMLDLLASYNLIPDHEAWTKK